MSGHGDPDVMQIVAAPVPEVARGEVLIRVRAAGVNRPDLVQRAGKYPPPPGASPVLGLEVAGTIAAVADDVTEWRIGDEVCALTPGGGYAEFALAPASHCLPVPRGLSVIDSAALPETAFTVWTNVFDRARLQPGECLLVHGGTSGIGTTAIQLAVAMGARVFATAGTDEKCAFCRKLGAELAVNHRTEDFVEVTQRATAGRGVDVILDMVGGGYVARNLKALAMEGRLVQIAFMTGARVELDLAPIMLKRLTVSGSTLRPRSIGEKAHIASALRARVWPPIEAGRIRPVIHKVFPFEEVRQAHRELEGGAHIGKIVLELR